jgi:hypothetical protein
MYHLYRGHRAFQCDMLFVESAELAKLTLEHIFGPEQSMYYTRSLLDLLETAWNIYTE